MDISNGVNIIELNTDILELILKRLKPHDVVIFTSMVSKTLRRKCKFLNWRNFMIYHRLFYFCGGGQDKSPDIKLIFSQIFDDHARKKMRTKDALPLLEKLKCSSLLIPYIIKLSEENSKRTGITPMVIRTSSYLKDAYRHYYYDLVRTEYHVYSFPASSINVAFKNFDSPYYSFRIPEDLAKISINADQVKLKYVKRARVWRQVGTNHIDILSEREETDAKEHYVHVIWKGIPYIKSSCDNVSCKYVYSIFEIVKKNGLKNDDTDRRKYLRSEYANPDPFKTIKKMFDTYQYLDYCNKLYEEKFSPEWKYFLDNKGKINGNKMGLVLFGHIMGKNDHYSKLERSIITIININRSNNDNPIHNEEKIDIDHLENNLNGVKYVTWLTSNNKFNRHGNLNCMYIMMRLEVMPYDVKQFIK